VKKIYFIRHAETEAIVDGIMAGGEYDTKLTISGRKQAEKAGESLRGKGIEMIAVSPMGRTLETAKIIAKQIGLSDDNIIENNLLIERAFGNYSGKPFQDYKRDVVEGQLDHSQVESSQVLFERINKAFEWLAKRPESTILVVSHGGVGRMFRLINQGLPHSELPGVRPFAPAEIDEFTI